MSFSNIIGDPLEGSSQEPKPPISLVCRRNGIQDASWASVYTRCNLQASVNPHDLCLLDLSGNKVENTDGVASYVCLLTLCFAHNQLTSLAPQTPRGALPTSLTRLNVSYNKLKHLKGLDLLPNLHHLDASHNCLTLLQDLSSSGSRMQTLCLSSNRIKCLDGIQAMEKLEWLDISNNRIRSEMDLRQLSLHNKLHGLRIQGCRLPRHVGNVEYRVPPPLATWQGLLNTGALPSHVVHKEYRVPLSPATWQYAANRVPPPPATGYTRNTGVPAPLATW
ncbi:hypothetical protein CYMTET_53547 [Cymbomonas tetramitiformis]|uniref:Uncharacterized protein n=1 Tax=Cymbomonas tetramitiformis TaxID=36881 RepID=A0AAE0ERM2_9CHLO|nr:hypothetical protein CYMTET_53547 [Cymbomonas tetramitiformis]